MVYLKPLGLLGLLLFLGFFPAIAQGFAGYYQYPDLHQNTIVFTAEGDLWKVPLSGGLAHRLTTHAEEERYPVISPDGKTIAYSASYEGPTEVYTMPIEGGLSTRWTYEGDGSAVCNWTPDGKIAYQTMAYSKLPNEQLVAIDRKSKAKSVVPLHQASEGVQNEAGTWFFIRPSDHRNYTKRYVGGMARQIWKFDGRSEARKLTTDHKGESFHPMCYQGRVYFITDRDGTMNIWSMDEEGEDLQQHTRHGIFDVRYANLDAGKIVYQHAADLWQLDLASGEYNKVNIRLATDLKRLREKWEEQPMRYITYIDPSHDGEKIALTARGRVFVAPVNSGRIVSFTEPKSVRYRDAIFTPDGKDLITLSDESGEFEYIRFAADGTGERKALTKDAAPLRRNGLLSPDGKWMAYKDVEKNLYLLQLETGRSQTISTNQEGIRSYAWSPDGQWLAFVQTALNRMQQIKVYNVDDGSTFDLTTDRANSLSPRWSPDGRFLYFLSDRSFSTLVGSPGGTRQPEPYWDASERIYHVALQRGTRSPFREKDELYAAEEDEETPQEGAWVKIDKEGIQSRIVRVPVAAGNYYDLAVNDKALYMMADETGVNAESHLKVIKITDENPEISTLASDISSFEMTRDGNKLLVRRRRSYYMVDAGTGRADLSEGRIDLSGWKFSLDPREDWKQIYRDAWRMERDYFYDPDMHGVDWEAMYDRYLPLVDRVTTRSELNDVIGQLISELSVLHAFSNGGDLPDDDLDIRVASLGARTSRDEAKGGFRIDYIYKADPDYPRRKSPLDDPYLDIRAGDVITHVNGRPALSAVDIGELIRDQAGKQVRLSLKRDQESRDVIVKPKGSDYWLRYGDWEYANRLRVDSVSDQQIGYLHMSAMGRWDIGQFYREFYPVFNRKGLILDMRNNAGGNIDAFLLEKLMRKAWMYWKDRTGEPYWNMHYAFRGHMVVLVNEKTGSNGETFPEGFRRLGLGTTLGTRTWGGQVWLNGANRQSDNGRAGAPMHGVYGDEGQWLIEGHGFVPDIELDNLPHATFNGQDAQLDAAIQLLQEKIAADPREIPPVPAYPDKSVKNNRR